ncbi:MAG TPA: TPM domain-containing protein, partial [Polyangiaceae bacterium]
AWKLGKKGKDDGLLMLIARDDRKFRIEVGYGLEGDVTDVIAARIQREVLTPAFRRGDFAGGIDAAFERLMRIASGQSVPESQEPALPAPERRRSSPGSAIGLFLFFFFFVLPLFGRIFGGSRRRRGFGTHALGAALGGLSGLSHRGGGSWGGGGFGGGGFRGGGGGFGGGGASGSW